MDARDPGDAEVTTTGSKVNGLPGSQAHDPGAGRQFRGAVASGEDATPVKQPTAEVVEVVPVVLMGE